MTGSPTHVRRQTVTMPMARLGPASRLPRFRWQQPLAGRPTPPNVGLSEDESRHGFNWGEDSILPYPVYEDYDREVRPAELDVLVMENDRLRATIAPTLGGRLLELRDLAADRDLVFRNPVFQPANLASLNAWFSGGIEWNGLIPGHTPFGCATVFAGVRETPEGPILRLYEFDRIVEATWQIDLLMPAGSAQLFAHGRIVNPMAETRLAYWWTNIAAPMAAGTRVLSPADYSIEHLWPGNNLGRCAFPREDWDASYPDNWENATSVFFRTAPAAQRFIAAVDRNGAGMAQTSTREMLGRKFFYFGDATGGQNWMDYLSRPGEGRYLEIQSGIAPTQNQRFALAAGEELDWTEVFVPVQLDPRRAHDPDYKAAVSFAAQAVDDAIPPEELARLDAFLREQARLPLDLHHSRGEPWGMRQERLLERPLAAGLDFGVTGPADFWDDLSRGLTVAENNLRDVPAGIAVSDLWTDRVAASAAAHGTSWLHDLVLAIALLDKGDTDAARTHADRSGENKPTWLGYRLQALLSADVDAATQHYLRAWNAGDAPADLAVEIATHLVRANRPAELKSFVAALPADMRDNERIVLASAASLLNEGRFDEVESVLMTRTFATIREGETVLSDLWIGLWRGRLEASLGRTATPEEVEQQLASHPIPATLDLRMHA